MSTEFGKSQFIIDLIHRFRWILAPMLVGVGFGVAALERWRPDVPEPARHRTFEVISACLSPIRDLTKKGQSGARRVAEEWGESESGQLRRDLMRVEAELQTTREELRRMGRVSGLRQWKGSSELEFLPADVVGFSTHDQSAILTINRGRLDNLEPGLPVVGQKGLAGVIREVSDRSARVQALSDPLSAVGVADVATRHRGMVFGRGREAELEFIPENEVQPIEPGSILITSGFGNSIYPKGLIVGKITRRRTNNLGVVFGLIEPAEKFSALEEALVIRRSDHAAARADEGLGLFNLQMPTTGTLTVAEPTSSSLLTVPAGGERP